MTRNGEHNDERTLIRQQVAAGEYPAEIVAARYAGIERDPNAGDEPVHVALLDIEMSVGGAPLRIVQKFWIGERRARFGALVNAISPVWPDSDVWDENLQALVGVPFVAEVSVTRAQKPGAVFVDVVGARPAAPAAAGYAEVREVPEDRPRPPRERLREAVEAVVAANQLELAHRQQGVELQQELCAAWERVLAAL